MCSALALPLGLSRVHLPPRWLCTHLASLTPQMTWDPDQDSQEECPVAEVQVLGET